MRRLAYIALLALSVAACARILGLREPGPRPFPHRAHVLEGVSCLRCHAGVDTAGDESPLHFPSDDVCTECHDPPHDPRPCGNCHGGPYTAVDAAQAREHVRFAHADHAEASMGQCVRCHGGVSRDETQMRPTLGTCVSCHEHQDDFELSRCGDCHRDLPSELRPPDDHVIHGESFEDHGAVASSAAELCASCHAERFCASCHGQAVPALPARMALGDPMVASVHRAGFASRHAEESRAAPGLCSTCHTEQTCRSCHDDRGVTASPEDPRGSPHPPNWVGIGPGQNEHGRAARRDPLACASCHGGAGEALCVSCHRVGGIGGNPHPPGWDSRKSMREAPCRACHVGAL